MLVSEIISLIILIIIGIIVVFWTIDRICKCIEKCKTMKVICKYISSLNKNELDTFMEDFNNAMKNGIRK